MIKVVPVIHRIRNGAIELLAFEHPLAGMQIVKGTLEDGESIEAGCVRELREESGLTGVADRSLGAMYNEVGQAEWNFYSMHCNCTIPDEFTFYTLDDGGHEFRFFWHLLKEPLSERWHPIFHKPILYIQNRLFT